LYVAFNEYYQRFFIGLLNLRGSDVSYNPVFISYVIVSMDTVELFIDQSKLESSAKEMLGESVTIKPYTGFLDSIASLKENSSLKVMIDPDACNWAIYELLSQDSIVHSESPVKLAKSLKNPIELQGLKNAHLRDAVALVKFFCWLNEMLEKDPNNEILTECGVATVLEEFRRKQDYFVSLSFGTVAGSGSNGAIIHYSPVAENCARIKKNTMFLLDSGAQYMDGTTDVTRTVMFGDEPASQHQKDCFTRVLKGHIAIDRAVFPLGFTGYKLDTLARLSLWEAGLDYNHGTGHGVGHFLNVHEGPQGIGFRKSIDNYAFNEGMTVTNEPGYYETGVFGIRIENVLIVKNVNTPYHFNNKQFLGFEHITLVPIQTSLINAEMLTPVELKWVNDYNRKCKEALAPRLKDDAKTLAYMEQVTAEIK
jgi:Xaa-Pro aminopeptidase